MEILRHATALPPDTAACVGAFDGFHLGHQELLKRAAARARRLAVVTFAPHPARVLAPEHAPPLLTTDLQRERVCAALGVDTLVLIPFDLELANTAPAAFARQVLIDGLRPAHVVVGPDFRFGKGRRGGTEELRALLAPAGIGVDIAPEIACPGPGDGKLSSTGIRTAVAEGRVADVLPMLGRWFAVAGPVVHGHKRGRTMGFPTANIACPDVLRPAPGVYAGVLRTIGAPTVGAERWFAVANIGQNPTFADGPPPGPPLVEAHALDASLDGDAFYGRELEFSFVTRLRDERRFPDQDALQAQIAQDIATARERLHDDALAHLDARPLRPPL